jgi:predicted Fe-Mo cluster-binding NifX family protein
MKHKFKMLAKGIKIIIGTKKTYRDVLRYLKEGRKRLEFHFAPIQI